MMHAPVYYILAGINSLYMTTYHKHWQVSIHCIQSITIADRYQLNVYEASQTLAGINSLYMTRYHKHWQVSTHYIWQGITNTDRYQLIIIYDNVSQMLTGINSLYMRYHKCWQVSTHHILISGKVRVRCQRYSKFHRNKHVCNFNQFVGNRIYKMNGNDIAVPINIY